MVICVDEPYLDLRPNWINIIRHPIERLMSAYYYIPPYSDLNNFIS